MPGYSIEYEDQHPSGVSIEYEDPPQPNWQPRPTLPNEPVQNLETRAQIQNYAPTQPTPEQYDQYSAGNQFTDAIKQNLDYAQRRQAYAKPFLGSIDASTGERITPQAAAQGFAEPPPAQTLESPEMQQLAQRAGPGEADRLRLAQSISAGVPFINLGRQTLGNSPEGRQLLQQIGSSPNVFDLGNGQVLVNQRLLNQFTWDNPGVTMPPHPEQAGEAASVLANIAESQGPQKAAAAQGGVSTLVRGAGQLLQIPQLREYGAQGEAAAQQGVQESQKRLENFPVQTEVGRQAVGAGQMGGDLAFGLATGGTGFLASFALSAYSSSYNRAVQSGAAPDEAARRGMASAGVALLTASGQGAAVQTLTPRIGDMAANVAANAALMPAQSTAERMIQGEPIADQNLLGEALAGGITGGAIHGVGMAAEALRGQKLPRTAEQGLNRPPDIETPTTPSDTYAGPRREVIPGQVSVPGADVVRPGGLIGAGLRQQPPGFGNQYAGPQRLGSLAGASEAPAGEVPDWLSEEMIRRGKSPSRVMNEFDVNNPGAADLIAKDPVVQFLERTNPELAARAKTGNITPDEIRQAVQQMRATNEPQPSSMAPAAEEVPPAPPVPGQVEEGTQAPAGVAARGQEAVGGVERFTPDEVIAAGVPADVVARIEANQKTGEPERFTPEEVIAAGAPPDVVQKIIANQGESNAAVEGNRPVGVPGERARADQGGAPAEAGGGGGVQAAAPERGQPAKPQEVKRQPFSRADVEQRLIDWHKQSPDYQAGIEQQFADEAKAEETAGAEGVFRGKIPDEVKRLVSPEELKRATDMGILRVAQGKEHSGGADALGSLGDERYAEMIRRQLHARQDLEAEGGGRKVAQREALDRAKEAAQRGGDPVGEWLASVHDALLAPKKDRTPYETMDAAGIPAGAKFEFQGEKFRVVDEGGGLRVLRDGGDYPEVPLDWLDQVPVDKGTMEEKPAPAPAATSDIGVFGQTVFRPATGSKQGGLFHEPTETPKSAEETAQDAKIRGKFKAGEGETGKIFGFGGEISPEGAPEPAESAPPTTKTVGKALFGDKGFIGGDVIPTVKARIGDVTEAARQLRDALAPQTAGEQAKLMKGIAREHGATLAQRGDRAAASLAKARSYFAGKPKEVGYGFIQAAELGGSEHPEMKAASDMVRKMLDERRNEVRALGKGQLENFILNYFPRLWKDPVRAESLIAQALGKRPLEGSKAFLKKRTVGDFSDGIEMGLEPVSDNPIDLVLLKIREMDRYILGQKMLAEMKQRGLAQFVKATDRPPEGYGRIDDKIAQVYGPPTVPVQEHVDKAQYDALNQVMDNLGIQHERISRSLGRPKAGGQILGTSYEGQNLVKTKFASDLAVLAHEIGHQLDAKYDLGRQLTGLIGPETSTVTPQGESASFRVRAPQSEFDRLTELRFAGGESPTRTQKKYNYSPEEQAAQVVEAFVHAPDRMKEVAPTIHRFFEDFVNRHPELAPLQDVRPGLAYERLTGEQAHGGLLKFGEYYAPQAAANVVNNYLSPGLRQKSGLFRSYLGMANVLNQAQLGWSAFHVGFTSMDAMTSKLALGLERAVEGKPAQAIKSLAATPLAPISNILKGSKLLREWTKPGSEGGDIARMVDAVRMAGGRARQDSFYRTQMLDKMVDAFKQGNILGGLLRMPGGITDAVTRPIFEYIVPRQKLGVFADLASKELAKLGPNADTATVRETLGKVWDSVDNRMGQVVYDNLFWKKAIKDLGMASIRSLGWNLGTFRELGGGAADTLQQLWKVARLQKPELTHRMAYMVAMPIMAGLAGGTLHYLMTGKRPEELKDYFFPKTGEQDANGKDVRLNLPSYMKDVYAYSHDPLGTLAHKVHPAITATIEALQNKDFYGTQIRNSEDPRMKQALDLLKFAGKQLLPYGVQGYQKMKEEGAPVSKRLLPFVGITQAPAWMGQSKAEQLAHELAGEHAEVGGRTADQVERADLKRGLVKDLKSNREAGQGKVEQAAQSGQLTRKQVGQVERRSMDPSGLVSQTRGMQANDARKVWNVATPQEREALKLVMKSKVDKADTIANDTKSGIMDLIDAGKPIPPFKAPAAAATPSQN